MSIRVFYEPNTSSPMVIFSERSDHVHIVDIFNKRRQVLTLPIQSLRRYSSIEIAGTTISQDGRKLFIGRSSGIYEYQLVRVSTLKDACLRYIRIHMSYWGKELLSQRLPLDLYDTLIPRAVDVVLKDE